MAFECVRDTFRRAAARSAPRARRHGRRGGSQDQASDGRRRRRGRAGVDVRQGARFGCVLCAIRTSWVERVFRRARANGATREDARLTRAP